MNQVHHPLPCGNKDPMVSLGDAIGFRKGRSAWNPTGAIPAEVIERLLLDCRFDIATALYTGGPSSALARSCRRQHSFKPARSHWIADLENCV